MSFNIPLIGTKHRLSLSPNDWKLFWLFQTACFICSYSSTSRRPDSVAVGPRRLVVPVHSIQMDLSPWIRIRPSQAKSTSLSWIWISAQMDQNVKLLAGLGKLQGPHRLGQMWRKLHIHRGSWCWWWWWWIYRRRLVVMVMMMMMMSTMPSVLCRANLCIE